MLNRLFQSALTVFGVSVIVFILIRVVPGDPISMMLPPGATEADIENIKRLYGLEKTMFEQYIIWLKGIVVGDWGNSITFRVPVLDIILSRLPATIELAIFSLVLAVIMGLTIAISAVYARHTKTEYVIDFIKTIFLSIPDFLWALLFVLIFSVLLSGMIPISGRIDQSMFFNFYTDFYLIESLVRFEFGVYFVLLQHMILPAMSLAIPLGAVIGHVFKHSILEILHQDFVILSRIKGFSYFRILYKDVLKNAAIPSITLIAVQFTFLIGGTVIIEKLFAFPGIGSLSIDAVINRDLPLIQGLVVCYSIMFIAINMAVDYSYYWLNPRLRKS